MFRNREQAAHELAQRLNNRFRCDPLVLAIAGGGVVTGAALARELGAEFDIVISRKLQAPGRPSQSIGAVSEGGRLYLDPLAKATPALTEKYLTQEIGQEFAALAHQKRLFRKVQPAAQVAGRSIVVTDDGIRTGATMITALQFVQTQNPLDITVAVPVASPSALRVVRQWCDDIVWLITPEVYQAIEEFYEGFPVIKEHEVVARLRELAQGTHQPYPEVGFFVPNRPKKTLLRDLSSRRPLSNIR